MDHFMHKKLAGLAELAQSMAVLIRYWGGFDAIPGDEIKMQTQSYAVQPCKLYFW